MGLMILLFLMDAAQAGDGISLSISCTIPAIPGVNAPLIEGETLKTQTDSTTQQKIEPQAETQSQTPVMVQQDTQKEEITSEEQDSLVTVKTLYSR